MGGGQSNLFSTHLQSAGAIRNTGMGQCKYCTAYHKRDVGTPCAKPLSVVDFSMSETVKCPICGWTAKRRPGFTLDQQMVTHMGYHALSDEPAAHEWFKARTLKEAHDV